MRCSTDCDSIGGGRAVLHHRFGCAMMLELQIHWRTIVIILWYSFNCKYITFDTYRELLTTFNTFWFYMIRTYDHAQVGAPNCKSTISGSSRQLLKTLNTCWFYMIRAHDCAHVGAPNCKLITSDASRRLFNLSNKYRRNIGIMLW